MKKEDLIKKLETADLPNLELQGHKTWLKNALIKWKYERQPSCSIFQGKILKPAGAFVVLLILVFFASNILYPTYTLAYVRNLAENNPQIKTLLEENDAKIKGIQIIKNRAYILITPKDEPSSDNSASAENRPKATLVQMEIKERKVVELKNIEATTPTITQEERDRAKKLIEKNEKEKETIKQFDSKSENIIEIEKITPLPSSLDQLELIKKGNVVEVVENREIKIIYNNQGERKEKEIDLTNDRITEAESTENR